MSSKTPENPAYSSDKPNSKENSNSTVYSASSSGYGSLSDVDEKMPRDYTTSFAFRGKSHGNIPNVIFAIPELQKNPSYYTTAKRFLKKPLCYNKFQNMNATDAMTALMTNTKKNMFSTDRSFLNELKHQCKSFDKGHCGHVTFDIMMGLNKVDNPNMFFPNTEYNDEYMILENAKRNFVDKKYESTRPFCTMMNYSHKSTPMRKVQDPDTYSTCSAAVQLNQYYVPEYLHKHMPQNSYMVVEQEADIGNRGHTFAMIRDERGNFWEHINNSFGDIKFRRLNNRTLCSVVLQEDGCKNTRLPININIDTGKLTKESLDRGVNLWEIKCNPHKIIDLTKMTSSTLSGAE